MGMWVCEAKVTLHTVHSLAWGVGIGQVSAIEIKTGVIRLRLDHALRSRTRYYARGTGQC